MGLDRLIHQHLLPSSYIIHPCGIINPDIVDVQVIAEMAYTFEHDLDIHHVSPLGKINNETVGSPSCTTPVFSYLRLEEILTVLVGGKYTCAFRAVCK